MSLYENMQILGLNWAQIYFVENKGMAFGMEFGGKIGKILLTLLRLIACPFGIYALYYMLKNKYNKFFIFCIALIVAGAIGNLIDSLFYGILFSDSAGQVAQFLPKNEPTYGRFLCGQVVDMFYFPIINTIWPTWLPIIGGKSFTFFDPIFNVADSSISLGAISLLIYQSFFSEKEKKDYFEFHQ